MKRYTGERTIDGISVLVDGEPLGNAAKEPLPELHAADRRQFRQRVGNDERRHRRRDRRVARRSCRLGRFPKAFP